MKYDFSWSDGKVCNRYAPTFAKTGQSIFPPNFSLSLSQCSTAHRPLAGPRNGTQQAWFSLMAVFVCYRQQSKLYPWVNCSSFFHRCLPNTPIGKSKSVHLGTLKWPGPTLLSTINPSLLGGWAIITNRTLLKQWCQVTLFFTQLSNLS